MLHDGSEHPCDFGDLVFGEEIDLQIKVGAFVAAAILFWLISTNVERKIASTEASVASMMNDLSNSGTPGISPRLTTIHALYTAA